MSRKTSISEKYWSKVQPGDPDACWPWLGSRTAQGYGLIKSGITTRRAHVVGWEIFHGIPFPADKFGLHRCDNPGCVNPHHIFPGTHRDNMRDMVAKRRHVDASGRRRSGPRLRVGGLCRNGHALTDSTIVIRSDGRACKHCLTVKWAKARANRKASGAAA